MSSLMSPEEFMLANVNAAANDFLGEGAFGYVSALGPKHVLKIGNNDGTRTYLEWVHWRQRHGKHMRGMPKVKFVLPIPGIVGDYRGGYMVVMERFKHTLKEAKIGYMASLVHRLELPPYMASLVHSFELETGVKAQDVSIYNMMTNGGSTWYLTDPSSDRYRSPKQWKERASEWLGISND